jgi:hypothetical protein
LTCFNIRISPLTVCFQSRYIGHVFKKNISVIVIILERGTDFIYVILFNAINKIVQYVTKSFRIRFVHMELIAPIIRGFSRQQTIAKFDPDF